ncbi:hypothetical protein Y032_0237g3253 [Ancylostoma ceylanicum]|uniref:Zinc finger CHCC-type domain-containing protein n=1 Tax=Ancylostoma ceylanicum TaxID=53326 RepID=A0A016SFK5_9BILA|nr:hypothetical protein Y032_0237g3253 [Ancylostoma ceylanicum]
MHLIAQRPPKDCGNERVVFCDGGHPALGHPRVFINLPYQKRLKSQWTFLESIASLFFSPITSVPSIRNDESAHVVGDPEAPTLARNPRHHL